MDENTEAQNYNNAISHFYRGELQRTYNWRRRLDRTTNWAVLIMAGILTWTFSAETRLHFVLLIGMVFVLFLALIESRRYRYYVVWNSRVRALEENFLAPLLCSEEGEKEREWDDIVAEDLKKPAHKIEFLEAFARRLRRVYNWLFLILVGSWFAKLAIHPKPATALTDIIRRASVASIDGVYVIIFVLGLFTSLVLISLYRWGNKFGMFEREAKGKIRSKNEENDYWRDV